MERKEVMTDVKITPEAQAVVKNAEGIVAQYQEYKIANNDEYSASGDILKKIKSKTKEIDDLRKSMTKPLDETKSKIMAFFKVPVDKLYQTEGIIKRAMLCFQQTQEKIRQEAEAKAKALADKEAAMLAKRAEKAKENGNLEKAEELQQQSEETSAIVPTVAHTVPNVKGISTKKAWKYKIVDASLIPREYMMPNEKMLGDIARANKGTLKIAGVEMYSEEIISSGRG